MSATLRPHQTRTEQQIEAAIAQGCRRIIVQAPTGFGKTILMARRLKVLQDHGSPAL